MLPAALPTRFRSFLFSVGVLLALKGTSPAAEVRYVPMLEAPRSLHIALATNLHVAFDTERLRVHTAWTGGGLNLQGTPHTGGKTPFLSRPDGVPFVSTAPLTPWAFAGRAPVNPQFISWATTGGITLNYQLGAGASRTIVTESLRAVAGYEQALARVFSISVGDEPVWFSAFAEQLQAPQVTPVDASAIMISTTNRSWLVAAAPASNAGAKVPLFSVLTNHESLTFTSERERGGDSERVETMVAGPLVRVRYLIPARSAASDLAIVVAAFTHPPANPAAVAEGLRNALRSPPKKEPRTTEPARLAAHREDGTLRGDSAFVIESFPLPTEARLGVTGMNWLPNGDLAVCTWPGEVWIVEKATGPVADARYRRFAAGLNEPLGLAVVNGDIVVAQKPELTRVRDTDGDGQADVFECLNDDWRFTGNYHAFTFGPAVEADGSFLLAFCGQRARWDVDLASWLVRVSADGSTVTPIAGGLRASNGIGLFGPERDIFATDNQGNWIGACKLNHIQPGRYYGHPAARPAPRDRWEQPRADFEPPAVWFPRALAPSAAGFATIPESGFGPFGGQLVVADFQNAVVLRVFLERVNDRWQGAVFPFLKGFASGANRVMFDPAGRLYVGGVENAAWPSTGPFEQSLERVTFTGTVPFEIREVRARADGFELGFTERVNPEFAGDPDSYAVSQFNYRHHAEYGSPEFDHAAMPGHTTITVRAAEVSPSGLRVRLRLDGWKAGYVTRVRASGVENQTGALLRSDEFFYTLNEIPKE